MNIFITGGTGFIGTLLSKTLVKLGHQITVLTRNVSGNKIVQPGLLFISGDSTKEGPWQKIVEKHDVILNMAGASIFGRWNSTNKREILRSRINTTQNIISALENRRTKKVSLLNISGIGYYGFHGDEYLDETVKPGIDFLAQVAAQWEETAEKARKSGTRVVLCRLGHVLGTTGGMLPKLVFLSKIRLGGSWGEGEQWISWIHQQDVCDVIKFLLDKNNLEGAINVTAPIPVHNKEFMVILNESNKTKPLVTGIPSVLIKLIAGEFSTVFLNGQRVIPRILLENGYTFQYNKLVDALIGLVPIYTKLKR
jgi:uncharacterized protein